MVAAMPESQPPLEDLSALSLAQIATRAAERKLPPVESWNPQRCGDSAMCIARDGTWFHEGTPIRRLAMVRLFSTLLRREADGTYALVTPVERLAIAVEDAPFVAVEMKSEGEGQARRLAFRLNTGDVVIAGPDHPLRIVTKEGEPHPYVQVRPGLDALLLRPVYYELAELALTESGERPGVWSGGTHFPLDADI
jgi:hypothetical protein